MGAVERIPETIRDILERHNLHWLLDSEEFEGLVQELEQREAIMTFPMATEANRVG